MPATKPARPTPRPALIDQSVDGQDSESVSRAIDSIHDAIKAIEARVSTRKAYLVDLRVGDNRITHGLGQRCSGCNLTPSIADASFAWCLTVDNDTQGVLTVIGIDQPGAVVEFY